MSGLWKCWGVQYSESGPLKTELIAGRHFRLNVDPVLKFPLRTLKSRSQDLLRIASSVYALDRISRRDRRRAEDGWARRFRIEIPVNDRVFWQSPSVIELLSECLRFLTGDTWEFHFIDDLNGRNVSNQQFLRSGIPYDTPPLVCLYSGGLDSAAGLTHRLLSERQQEFLPVTVWHRSGLRTIIRAQLARLRERFGVQLPSLVVKYAMVRPSRLGVEETSQRSRSFLFCSVGAVTAWMSGASQVEVYESGVGAVNLPLQRGAVGSRTTRSSHPYFLRILSHLLSEVLSHPMQVTLPFIHHTKGEVVKALRIAGLEDLARSTISCVHYPLRHKYFKRCGLCPACLFRRVALASADINEDEQTYKSDLFRWDAASLGQDRLSFLKAFIIQISNLSELETAGMIPKALRRHLCTTKVLANGESMDSFVDVFRRYRREWLQFIGRGKAMHMKWADLASSENSIADRPT